MVLQWCQWVLQGLWMVQSSKIMLKREQGIPAIEALLTDLGGKKSFFTITIRITPWSILIPLGCAPIKHKPGSASPGWGAQGSTAQDTQLLLQQLGASSPRLILGLCLRGCKIDAFQHTQPISAFCHHKEPGIICPLEHRTNAHLTFPCYTFWASTSPCRGSRTPIHTAHLTKSCWLMPYSDHTNCLTSATTRACSLGTSTSVWYIASCSWFPILFHAVSIWLQRGTPRQQLEGTDIYQDWRFPTAHQHHQVWYISRNQPSFACSHPHLSPITFICLIQVPRSQGVGRLHGKKGFFTSNEAQKIEPLEKFTLFILKNFIEENLELLNPEYFRDKENPVMKPFLLIWVVWKPPFEGFPI